MLIGFAGKKGVGKDTVGRNLVKTWKEQEDSDRYADLFAFADPLKEMVAHMTGIPLYLFHDPKAKELVKWDPETGDYGNDVEGITLRHLLQWMGTDIVRNSLGNKVWVNAAMAKVKRSKAALKVVTDVRFPEEADAIKKLGGKVVLIYNDYAGKLDRHESENSMAEYPFDAYIQNDWKNKPEELDGAIKQLL